MRKIVGIGETVLDIIFETDKPTNAVPGGSVLNGLVSLGRLDIPVEFVSEIGNDRVGEIIRKFLKENNVSTNHVNVFPDGKSAISLAFLNDKNDAEYIFYKDYPRQRLDVAFPMLNESDILVFGAFFSINPAVRERVMELVEYAVERRSIIYYDPNFRLSHAHEAIRLTPSILENLEYASIVRGSNEDFYHMFGLSDPDKVYDQKIKFYCPNFIYTKAEEGVYLCTSDFRKNYPVEPLIPLSTIGAGDNFNAGILYGLIKYNVTIREINHLSETTWDKIIDYAIRFSQNVCMSYENSISQEFARSIASI